ncbi:hypothetical protein, partial [Sphingobium aromaticivastans]|uniref:hypothetical protein n=1 Tax=Sphingobium aromaticivastans TaxID=1778665 RepID=UPI00301B1A22
CTRHPRPPYHGDPLIQSFNQYATVMLGWEAAFTIAVMLNLFQHPFLPTFRRLWGTMDAETSSA